MVATCNGKLDEYLDGQPILHCCHSHVLGLQLVGKSSLAEAVFKAGHYFELYPTYHCECNFIERFWGATKRIARINCSRTASGLKKNLP